MKYLVGLILGLAIGLIVNGEGVAYILGALAGLALGILGSLMLSKEQS